MSDLFVYLAAALVILGYSLFVVPFILLRTRYWDEWWVGVLPGIGGLINVAAMIILLLWWIF